MWLECGCTAGAMREQRGDNPGVKWVQSGCKARGKRGQSGCKVGSKRGQSGCKTGAKRVQSGCTLIQFFKCFWFANRVQKLEIGILGFFWGKT